MSKAKGRRQLGRRRRRRRRRQTKFMLVNVASQPPTSNAARVYIWRRFRFEFLSIVGAGSVCGESNTLLLLSLIYSQKQQQQLQLVHFFPLIATQRHPSQTCRLPLQPLNRRQIARKVRPDWRRQTIKLRNRSKGTPLVTL